MKRGFGVGESHGRADDGTPTVSWSVEIWEQPWHLWAIFRLYHVYDMQVIRVPGVRWIDSRTGGVDDDGDVTIPWFARQGLRCYYLSVNRRVVLARFDVDQGTYDKLR